MSNQDNILSHFYAGATKTIKFTFENQDITGWSLILILKDGLEEDALEVLSITHVVGDSVLDDPTNGVLYFTIDSESSDIELGRYDYQFIREIGSETPRNLTVMADGKVKVQKSFE